MDAFDRHLIKLWLESVPNRFVDTTPLNPLPKNDQRRKRCASDPMVPQIFETREGHPQKRQRPSDSDDGAPEQSTNEARIDPATVLADQTESPAGIDSPPALNRLVDPELPSSADCRSTPPRGGSVDLRRARPPVWMESLETFGGHLPTQVDELIDLLQAGVNECFIPKGFKGLIDRDPGLKTRRIKMEPRDYDHSDMRTEKELSDTWKKVKTIYQNASDCQLREGDENAWSDDVVRHLLQLAIDIHGGDRWSLHNIKSQSIDPRYLPTVRAPTLANESRTKIVDRKAGYVLTYSHRNRKYSDLYERLEQADRSDVGPTLAAWTRRKAVFSGFEVKSAQGSRTEAQLQMSIWIAASLRKKQELADLAKVPFEPANMIEPVFTIVGHDHSVHLAYPRRDPKTLVHGTHVLGPDVGPSLKLSTISLRGVFQLLRLYGNVLEYAADEGPNGYLGRFYGRVLQQLPVSTPDTT